MEPDQLSRIVEDTRQSIPKSQKIRKTDNKHSDSLLNTSSGKIPVKPLSKKQRNYLQSIPKDTIAAYFGNKK